MNINIAICTNSSAPGKGTALKVQIIRHQDSVIEREDVRYALKSAIHKGGFRQ